MLAVKTINDKMLYEFLLLLWEHFSIWNIGNFVAGMGIVLVSLYMSLIELCQ